VTDTSGGLPPAGWYPDPYGAPHDRWWDGQQWSEHVNTPAPAEPASQPPAFAEPAAQQPSYEQAQYQAPEQQYEPQPATQTQQPYQQPATQTQQPYQQPATQTQQPYQGNPASQTQQPEQGFSAPQQYQQPQQFQQPEQFQQPQQFQQAEQFQQPVEPHYGQPEFAQPEFAQPDFAQPSPAQPAFAQPEFAQPAPAQPEFAQPSYEQPEFAQPTWQQPAQPEPQAANPTTAGGFDAWQQAQQQPTTPQAPEQPTFAQPASDPFGAAPATPESQATPSWAEQAPASTPTWGAGPDAAAAQATPDYPPQAAASSSSIDDLFPGAPRSAQATPFPAAAQGGGPDFGQLIAGGGSADEGWPGDNYVEPPRNSAATAALVLGILSIPLVGLVSIIGVILAAVGLSKAARLSKESGVAVGRGKALVGLVLSILTLGVAIVIGLFFQAQALSFLNLNSPSASPNGGGPTDGTVDPATGNIPLAVGEQGVILDESGAPAITFTVTSIQPDPVCTAPEEDQLSAENGQFIAVGMTFVTSATYVSVMQTGADMQLSSNDWLGYAADGTELVNSDAGLSCLAESEQLPLDIPAGTTTSGTYVLDLSTGATSISWSPSDVTDVVFNQTRWEWPTISAQ
jgi:hypothetical protein